MLKGKWLVCSDIFGKTEALVKFVSEVFATHNVSVLSPYKFVYSPFKTESDAYEAFTEHGGMTAYVDRVINILRVEPDIQGIIGFSAGGAAAWKACALHNQSDVKQLICFYPGQIRHFLETPPSIPSHLIFPANELHFNLDDVINRLKDISTVSIARSSFKHGFMNVNSSGYNEGAYQHYLNWLRATICRA